MDNSGFQLQKAPVAINWTPQPTAQSAPQKQGGLAGFLGGVVNGITSAPKHFINTDIVNPIKETSAQLTGNRKALANARQQSNVELGLGQKGTDFVGGAKNFAGNSAQLLLDVAAPGANTIRSGAAIGAGMGGASALTNRNSTVNDVLEGGLVGGATGGALGVAGKVLGKIASRGGNKSGGFLDNLTTQGQQMQARGLGISGGNKVGGLELAPQDTERMLQTLKDEGIKNTGNANSVARDVVDKIKTYGQQIADHFKANDAPLKPEDTKVIADNFMKNIDTTDPRVLKEAQILANDLQKNVTSTKSLWDFRRSLDSRIPDSKFMDASTSNKVTALKAMRGYVSKELGNVPGMSNYHALSEIKPFLGKGMRELNQPGGSIVSRVLSSGPVQQAEATLGKGMEAVGNLGGKEAGITAPPAAPSNVLEKVLKSRGIPVKYESDELTGKGVQQQIDKMLINPSVGEAQDAARALTDKGFAVNTKMGTTIARKSTSGRGIPVTSVESEARGLGTPDVVNETVTGKSPDEITNTIDRLENSGYHVTIRNGAIQGRKSLNYESRLPYRRNFKGGTSVFEPSSKVPVTQISGKRQIVPLQSGEESTTIIPAKPRQFEGTQGSPTVHLQGNRTAIPLTSTGNTERDIINTSDIYEEIVNLPVSDEVKQTLLQRLGISAPTAKNFASGIFRQGATASAGGAMVPGQPSTTQQQQPTDTTMGTTDIGNSVTNTTQPQTTDPFAPENVQANVQAILAQGGKMKDVSEYLANVKAINDLKTSSTGTDQKITTAQQKDIASVKNASGLLDAIEQQFAEAGGGKGIAGYASDIPVVGQYLNTKMGAYNQTKVDAAVAYAKALAGSSGNGGSNQTLIEEVAKALPSITDTPAQAAQKLANMRMHLAHREQTVLNYPYSASDLQSSQSAIDTNLAGNNYGTGAPTTDVYSSLGL